MDRSPFQSLTGHWILLLQRALSIPKTPSNLCFFWDKIQALMEYNVTRGAIRTNRNCMGVRFLFVPMASMRHVINFVVDSNTSASNIYQQALQVATCCPKL